jgi:hypothetical protein
MSARSSRMIPSGRGPSPPLSTPQPNDSRPDRPLPCPLWQPLPPLALGVWLPAPLSPWRRLCAPRRGRAPPPSAHPLAQAAGCAQGAPNSLRRAHHHPTRPGRPASVSPIAPACLSFGARQPLGADGDANAPPEGLEPPVKHSRRGRRARRRRPSRQPALAAAAPAASAARGAALCVAISHPPLPPPPPRPDRKAAACG